jgi:hypothetical protein
MRGCVIPDLDLMLLLMNHSECAMKMLPSALVLLGIFGMARADAPATQIPSAVISDPEPDTAHPPRSARVLVPVTGWE